MKGTIVYRSISVTDLEQAGYILSILDTQLGFIVKSVLKDGKPHPLDHFYHGLYVLGIRRNTHLILQAKCQHIKLDGTRTNNYRFCGEERGDKDWIKSGYASEEAILHSSKMRGMVKAGMNMQKGNKRK